ncbi:MAG TPA: TIM-barrel domain-containing protein [Acidobacteriaceae bacterium]|nr:TIM-barrel domain-containing protein [Acidobacteriaceae bacterium]
MKKTSGHGLPAFVVLEVLLLAVSGAKAQQAAGPGFAVSVQPDRVVLTKDRTTVVLEPYAPNIVRVSVSRLKSYALAAPGYGILAKPDASGWSYQATAEGDTYRSGQLSVTIPGPPTQHSPALLHQETINQFFSSNGGLPYANVQIRFQLPNGSTLVDMQSWFMNPPSPGSGNMDILHDRRPTDPPFYQVGATFSVQPGEHYYGLGENQQGRLDHRDQSVRCWSNYGAAGGESFCVPLLVTNKGYAVLWDNPSKTIVEPYFNEQTKWRSQVGQRVSFFVIVGRTTDALYEGYRLLTGPAPLLPKAAYGFIQSKERYATQAEIMAVAKGYRERHLPCDTLVVDFFYYPHMGDMDFIRADWPDPKEMNDELHQMGFHTLISVWPRFAPGSRYYEMLRKNGWFYHLADGQPTTTNGLPEDKTGSNLDMTNPAAAQWFWHTIDQNIISKGFDAIWTDETEPDIPPNGSYYFIGPGTEYFNVYPLFETTAVYDGMRRDMKERAMILARAAYTGAQRNATIFWSSDISPTWNTLERQVPAGLDVTASGLPYWTDDVGGFWSLPTVHHPVHAPLIDPATARYNVGGDEDYPELYVRWFEYGTFMPILRTHGMRRFNTVWSYGDQATPILEKYLRLRYALIPYIYSLAYHTYETGAPYMRALFMDFPNDPKVDTLADEFMFGPDFLVAPVTHQAQTSRSVYLPAGADWYNYWTNEKYRGGQTIVVSAPIDWIPLFVRAGSILPIGDPVEDTDQPQGIRQIRIYPGANATFRLYEDDGTTYNYEKTGGRITVLHWDDRVHRFSHTGATAWTVPDAQVVKVMQAAQ